MEICAYQDCGRPVYAKKHCHAHYEQMRKGSPLAAVRWGPGNPSPKQPCRIEGCTSLAMHFWHRLCSKHYQAWRRHGDPTCKLSSAGYRNANWKGGVAEYKHHYQRKKNRIIALEKSSWRCKKCGLPTKSVASKDRKKSNPKLENLIPMCPGCIKRYYR